MSSPYAATGFRHLTHRLKDPSEFGVAVSGAVLAADFLAPQTSAAIIEQFQSPGWALDFHQAGVKARICGPLAPGWASLGLMRARTESWFHGFEAQPGVLVCNPPGEGIDGRIAPGFASAAVNVPQDLWEQCRLLAGVDHLNFGAVKAYRLEPRIYADIERRLRATRNALREARSPAALRAASREARAFAMEVATLAWLLSARPAAGPDSPRNRARLARRAEEWMRAHLGEPWQIPEVCLALRVSRRELEYAFRSSFDTSPRDFLQALRLNAIRRALVTDTDQADSVSRLALDHGITHFGRFSAHYRALFGESPSKTRRSSTLFARP